MSVLIAGRNTAQLDRLKALADSATGHLPLIVRSISEVRRHLDEQCFDALILDFDSFEDAAVEVEILGFLEGLSERNQVRRLIFLSGQGLPLTVSPVSQLLLASHCHPATPDQQIGEMLCAQPNGTSLKQFRGLSRFQVGAGDGSYWTYSPEMRSILSQLESMAKHDVTILLIGETGSGKSHLARVIHQMSHRNSAKCHSVACGALPSDVIESELFGHVRGAFTGADRTKVGRFEAAGCGTLLLDEIDTLSLASQARLLHVVESGEYQPVGSAQTNVSQARIVAASNRDLRSLVAEGCFRIDLFYRLSTLEFRIPPLRERPHDILPLAAHFIQEMARTQNVPPKRAEVSFLRRILAYGWPGNVRELQNQMRRVVLLSGNGMLTADLLSPEIQAGASLLSSNGTAVNGTKQNGTKQNGTKQNGTKQNGTSQHNPDDSSWDLQDQIGKSERECLQSALAAHNNNRSATARAVGMSRFGLYKKMERLGLHSPAR